MKKYMIAIILSLFIGSANAATITFNQNVDLDALTIVDYTSYKYIGEYASFLSNSAIVADGDDVVLTFNFLNNKALILSDRNSTNSADWLSAYLNSNSGSIGNYSVINPAIKQVNHAA